MTLLSTYFPRRLSFAAKWFATIGMLLCAPSHAATFDCQQARTSAEKLICSDAKLSELDSRLNEIWQAANSAATANEKRRSLVEQRTWLTNVRNKCADVACLNASYMARLDALNPLADSKLSCEEMRRNPEVFSESLDLGSGSYSPTDVDYECPESLNQQKFMQPILLLAERIRGEEVSQCSGTLMHVVWRVYALHLAWAGFHPRDFAQKSGNGGWESDSRSLSATGGLSGDKQVLGYFRNWSEANPVNYQLYAQFAAAYQSTLPLLARHYRKTSRLSATDSQSAAQAALVLILNRAAGDFSRESFPIEEPGLAERLQSRRFQLDGLDVSTYPDGEVYGALTAALLHNAPLPTIKALAEKTNLHGFENHEVEPLLAFATGELRNLEYLIDQDVPVDAANGFGKTALFYAIGANQMEAARLLLSRGANVNHTYKSSEELRADGDQCVYPNLEHTRRTPLMHAAQNSTVAMVRMLIEAGADQQATDDEDFNALDYADMGKNAEVATYLKSLGLEYGSRHYGGRPDVDVDLKFTATIPMDGWVTDLRIAAGRPDVMVASVQPRPPIARNKLASSKPGIYLMSIADPDHPALLSVYQNMRAVRALALSPDGRRAYFRGIRNIDSTADAVTGLGVLDISDPRSPVLLDWMAGDFTVMHLSPDGKNLYVQQTPSDADPSLLVFDAAADHLVTRCVNPFSAGDAKAQPIVAIASVPGEPLLLVLKKVDLFWFDVHDPCRPVKIAEMRDRDWLDGIQGNERIAAEANQTFLISELGGIDRYRVGDPPRRAGHYGGYFETFELNSRSKLLVVSGLARVEVLHSRPGGQLGVSQRLQGPDISVAAALLSDDGHLYVGWDGGLGIAKLRTQ